MKILIRNLDRKTTEEQLNELFKQHGDVKSCDLVIDVARMASKGFAFVEMENPKEANKAIIKLNNSTLGANKIRVKLAE